MKEKTINDYILLEKANIDKEYWDMCEVIDGIIYTPQIENEEVEPDRLDALEKNMKQINETLANLIQVLNASELINKVSQ